MSFLSSPRLPCNQCPTNKKQKSSSIFENLPDKNGEKSSTSLNTSVSAPSNKTSDGFSNFNCPTICFVLLSNLSKATFVNPSLENSDVNSIILEVRVGGWTGSDQVVDETAYVVIPSGGTMKISAEL